MYISNIKKFMSESKKLWGESKSFWGTSKYGDFEKNKPADKVIFNMFICGRLVPNWEQNVEILKTIQFPTSVESSKGHHNGLAIQVLLDLDLKSAEEFSNEVISKLPDKPLIVIADVNVVMKKQPIGYYFDQDLWEPGRYFDKLVSQGKRGLYIHTKDMPKVNKYE